MPYFNPRLPNLQLPYAVPSYSVNFPAKLVTHNFHALRDLAFGVLFSGLIVATNLTAQQHHSTVVTQAQTRQTNAVQPEATPATPPPAKATPAVTPSAPKPTSQDLQALLDKWQQDNKSATYGVVVQELGGDKRSASLSADAVFEAASLYKLYLADYIYTKADQGKLSLSEPLGSGRTFDSCLELMITVSDNFCGESIGYAVGWVNLNSFVRQAGFNETTLVNINQTSAADLAKFFEQLQAGNLISPVFTNELLGYMRQQIYRSAIPAGVPGTPVADKVGYIDDYWHDAAIVYHPKGNYVLVVLSRGSGVGPIKDLSQRVSDFMNQ